MERVGKEGVITVSVSPTPVLYGIKLSLECVQGFGRPVQVRCSARTCSRQVITLIPAMHRLVECSQGCAHTHGGSGPRRAPSKGDALETVICQSHLKQLMWGRTARHWRTSWRWWRA